MATVNITDQNFDESISTGLTLVDFWADWCGPCKMIAPVLEELSNELGEKVTIAKLDVDANPTTPSKFGVQGIPTMILFKDGQLVDRLVGALPKQHLVEFLEKHMA